MNEPVQVRTKFGALYVGRLVSRQGKHIILEDCRLWRKRQDGWSDRYRRVRLRKKYIEKMSKLSTA